MPLTFILSYDSHDRQVKVTYSADKNPTTQRSQRACSSSHSCQGQRWLCTWTQVSLSSWPSALVTVPHDLPLSERPKVGSPSEVGLEGREGLSTVGQDMGYPALGPL